MKIRSEKEKKGSKKWAQSGEFIHQKPSLVRLSTLKDH